MSFFDDLKKPLEKTTPVKNPHFFNDRVRLKIARELCSYIESQCLYAKKEGKQQYRCYCCWSMGWDSDKQDGVGISILCVDKPREYNQDCMTQDERNRILLFMRDILISQGFPANVVSSYDYVAVHGSGLFVKHGEKIVYTIKVDVRW